MTRPDKFYCVSFLIDNPPDEWDWVDHAVFEATGIEGTGDFSDGCTATYEFNDKETAVQFLELLKDKNTIGKHRKFNISTLKISAFVPMDNPPFWKEVPFDASDSQ